MRNIEKLRDYFLGKDPQLKETMADNSLRLIGIEGKHFVLRTELLKRLVELRTKMEEADEELQKNIDAVIEDLEEETQARTDADDAFREKIFEDELDISWTKDQVENLINNIVSDISASTPSDKIPNVGAIRNYVPSGGETSTYILTGDFSWLTEGYADIEDDNLIKMDNIANDLLQKKRPDIGITLSGDDTTWISYSFVAATDDGTQKDFYLKGTADFGDSGTYNLAINYTKAASTICHITFVRAQ